MFKISIPAITKMQPFTKAAVRGFAAWWEDSYESRLNASVEIAAENKNVIRVDKHVSSYGDVTLFPEQEGVVNSIYEAMFVSNRIMAALQDGHMGSGKTVMAGAIAAKYYNDGHFAPFKLHNIMVIVPTGNPEENWRREFDRMGLSKLVRTRKIYIAPNSIFSTEFGQQYCDLIEDDITGDAEYKWNPIFIPDVLMVDEAHLYARKQSVRTKKLLKLVGMNGGPKVILWTGTAIEKVNDARVFAVACRTKFMDVEITENTFDAFAGQLDSTPGIANAAATKRLRDVLSPYIFSIPYIRPKYKAINSTLLIDFEHPAARIVYGSAHSRYVIACKKTGKNTRWGQMEKLVALNNFLKTAEPMKAWWIADQVGKHYHEGKIAPAVFCVYKETIAEIAFRLVDRYNVPRSAICLLWGGKREYKTEELLSPEEMTRLATEETFMMQVASDRALRKRALLTMRYMQDAIEHSENSEEQAHRHAKLSELKLLGKQSKQQRQIEVDNFQDGTATICLATLATGGISLSLDKHQPHLLRREGYFTPPFSGRAYLQALGRLVRRASIEDAFQRTLLMLGTVEEFNVMPILDNKLKSMGAFSGAVMDDVINLMSDEMKVIEAPIHQRSDEEAAADAEADETHGLVEVSYEDEENEDEEVEALLD